MIREDTPEEKIMLERAKWFARMVHADETRMDGQPYYTHPEWIVEELKDQPAKVRVAGNLHDCFENARNPDTIRLLASDYFPEDVIHIVETLTNDKNIHYVRYIDVVCNNPYALIIKLKDMIHNTSDINQPYYPAKLKAKYREACVYMIMKRGIDIPQILKDRLEINDEELKIKEDIEL